MRTTYAGVMIDVTHTGTRYSLTLTAPEGEHIVIDDRGTQVAVTSIDFDIITDGARRLNSIGVHFHAKGVALREDGTRTRAKRLVQGGNLKRIPLDIRLALQEGIRESLGDFEDPLGQLNGYDGR